MNVSKFIDRPARTLAATLIRRYRENEITYEQLSSAWPTSKDRSLKALAVMIWHLYYDLNESNQTNHPKSDLQKYELLTRYALFSDTELHYEWPCIDVSLQKDSYRLGAVLTAFFAFIFTSYMPYYLRPIELLCLFIIMLLSFSIAGAIFNRRVKLITKSGDLSVWPFLRRSDFEKEIYKQII